MKARVPRKTKLTKEQTLAAQDVAQEYWKKIEFIFYFACLLSLNDRFNFGDKRLTEFVNGVQDVMKDINFEIDQHCADILVIRLINKLKQCNIDYEKILDVAVTIDEPLIEL